MSVRVTGPRGPRVPGAIDTTSKSRTWSRGLSPFIIGPVDLYGGHRAHNVENGWQYSKLYQQHADQDGNPTPEYFEWAAAGWANPRAVRYPMGKGVKPLCSLWDGRRLTYVEARRAVYCPLYAAAVVGTAAFGRLTEEYSAKGEVWLWDFDGYDHVGEGMSFADVLGCENRKMGHSFVLAMLLENQRAWEGTE